MNNLTPTTAKGQQIKARNEAMKQYILNAINSEGYEITTNTEAEKIAFLLATFKSEYGYSQNIRYYGTIQKTFENWLMGLPSCFNIDFMNYRILEIGKEWQLLPQNATERQEDKFLAEWWARIYMQVRKLANKHNLHV